MTKCPKNIVPSDRQADCNHKIGLTYHSETRIGLTTLVRVFAFAHDVPNPLEVYGGDRFNFCPDCGQRLEV